MLAIGSVAATEDNEVSEGEQLYFGPTQLLVRFDEPMDTGTVESVANYRLVEAGPDGLLETAACEVAPVGDDEAVDVSWAVYVAATDTAALGLQSRVPLGPGHYRLLACADLEDVGGNPLQAAPFTRDFEVEARNLLVNPNLDGDLGSWETPAAEGALFAYSPLDADGIATSGSARSTETPITTVTAGLSQCLPAEVGAYAASAWVRAFGSPSIQMRASGYSTLDCSGPAIDEIEMTLRDGGTGGLWSDVATVFLLPPGSMTMSVDVRSGDARRFTVRSRARSAHR